MQNQKRSVSRSRRSTSVKNGGTGVASRAASVTSSRGNVSRSHSLRPSSQRSETKVATSRPTVAVTSAGATSGSSRKVTPTIREQLPTLLRPSHLLAQRAALRTTSVKTNAASIPELVRHIRQLYASWPSDTVLVAAPSARGKPMPLSAAASPHGVILECRSVSSPVSEDPAKARRLSQDAVVTDAVLAVQQLGAVLFPAAMELPPECTNRRNTKRATTKYWKVLLQKSNSAIPFLLAAARNELVGSSAFAAAELLALLYNILRNTPSDKQKKLVRLSDKLGLMNVCGVVLRAYSKGTTDDGKAAMTACESVGLLLALCESYSPKVAVVARISRMLTGVAEVFQVSAAQFATTLSDDAISLCVTDPEGGQPKDATRLIIDCETLRCSTFAQSSTLLHLILALFTLSKSAANAAELGSNCASSTAMILRSVANALSELTPMVPAGDCASQQSDGSSRRGSVPLRLNRWFAHLELVAFWALALLQRLCHHPQTRRACATAVHEHHLLSSLQSLIHVGVSEVALANRFELVQSALMGMSVVLCENRADGLSELDAAGGLSSVVDDVLAFPSGLPGQWLQLYSSLCSVYGVSAVPTRAGQSANVMNKRLPAAILQKYVKDNRKRGEPQPARPKEVGTTAAELPSPNESQPNQTSEAADAVDSFAPANADQEATHLHSGLLPIDAHPDWFSPELAGGRVQAATMLPPHSETTLPWEFTDVPPPNTAEHYFQSFSACGESADLSRLTPPSDAQRVDVLRHHIARMKGLDSAAHDSAETPQQRHAYYVVYERDDQRDANNSESVENADNGVGANTPSLRFAANFECGNLQRAIKVTSNEYDLVLSWDTASNSYTQWFCFSVSNYEPGALYRFNIVNMEKNDSTFNEGQRPLLMHVPEAAANHESAQPRDWKRTGQDILYFKSPYTRHPRDHLIQKENAPTGSSSRPTAKKTAPRNGGKSKSGTAGRKGKTTGNSSSAPSLATKKASSQGSPGAKRGAGAAPAKKQQWYYTASFTVKMPPSGGSVYLCNCFPFTYSELRRHVEQLETETRKNGVALMTQSLCVTPGGLAVPLLTATSLKDRETGTEWAPERIRERPVVVLDARVHPGETNGSWVMQGMLDLLLAPSTDATRAVASCLLDSFVFKIIPMLNADGVVMGNHRCSIPGFDLNRDYLHPDTELNPVVYSMKRLIQHMSQVEGRKVVLYGDFHGHSKAKNFLLYGCTRRTIDVLRSKKAKKDGLAEPCPIAVDAFAPEKLLPALLSQLCPAFSIEQSNFSVLRSKRGTARISVYKEYGVRMSLGVEGTMMGGRGATHTLQDALALKGDGTVALNWCGAAADQYDVETHYNQDTYRTFGAMFLVALYSLVQCEATVVAHMASNSSGVSASPGQTDETERPLEEEAGVRVAWLQAQSAGSTREPPKMLTLAACELCPVPSSAVAAGPYVLATRSERRDGEASPTRTSPVPNGTPNSIATPFAPLTVAAKAQALTYLLRSEQLALGGDEDTEDIADDEAGADDVDDDNSEGGDVTGETEAGGVPSGEGPAASVPSVWAAEGGKSSSSSEADDDEEENEAEGNDEDDDDDDDVEDDDDTALVDDDDEGTEFMGSTVIPADILAL